MQVMVMTDGSAAVSRTLESVGKIPDPVVCVIAASEGSDAVDYRGASLSVLSRAEYNRVRRRGRAQQAFYQLLRCFREATDDVLILSDQLRMRAGWWRRLRAILDVCAEKGPTFLLSLSEDPIHRPSHGLYVPRDLVVEGRRASRHAFTEGRPNHDLWIREWSGRIDVPILCSYPPLALVIDTLAQRTRGWR